MAVSWKRAFFREVSRGNGHDFPIAETPLETTRLHSARATGYMGDRRLSGDDAHRRESSLLAKDARASTGLRPKRSGRFFPLDRWHPSPRVVHRRRGYSSRDGDPRAWY